MARVALAGCGRTDGALRARQGVKVRPVVLPVLPVCLLFLLLALASCSPRSYGDPLLNAWADACADGGTPDAAGLVRFHDLAADYERSPVFILKAQDVPEIEDVVREIVAFSACEVGSGEADAAELKAVTDRLEALLLSYGRLSSLSSERSSSVIVLILLLLSSFSFLFIFSLVLFLHQQRHFAELRRKTELERAVSVATIKMQEDERGRIYKELHDTIAQDSRSALFALQNLRRHIHDDPDARDLYERIERLEGANIENVRSVIRNIIPPDLLGDFRTVLLEWAANVSHGSAGGTKCRLSLREDADFSPLSQEQRLHLFRIMQEAVSNASRHSGAEEISVLFRGGTLPDGGRSLVLVVSDDGKGFDPAAVRYAAEVQPAGAAGKADTPAGMGHYGIRGMQSRAEVLGGVFRIQSEPGEGCEVFVEIPLRGRG